MSTVQATNLKNGNSVSNNIVLDASGNAAFAAAVTVAGNATITGTLQANGVTGSVYPLVQGTVVASTSGTSIDFTGIPSWARRVTVMLNGVSTNGTSAPLFQLGAGSVLTSGYLGASVASSGTGSASNAFSSGFRFVGTVAATQVFYGALTLTNVTANVWAGTLSFGETTVPYGVFGGGAVSLSGALDRVRITTVGGTDTFDAGTINLLWE